MAKLKFKRRMDLAKSACHIPEPRKITKNVPQINAVKTKSSELLVHAKIA